MIKLMTDNEFSDSFFSTEINSPPPCLSCSGYGNDDLCFDDGKPCLHWLEKKESGFDDDSLDLDYLDVEL